MNKDKYYAWDDLADKIPDAWLWGTQDTSYRCPRKEFAGAHAKTLHKDLAAYYLPEEHKKGRV